MARRKQDKEILCVRIKPGMLPEKITITNDLDGLKKGVEGYIEVVQINKDFCIVINEEGKLNDSKPNFFTGNDLIFGTALIVKQLGENFITMTDEDAELTMILCESLKRAKGNESSEPYQRIEVFVLK